MIKFDREFNKFGELSNFWRHAQPLVYQGETYATAEHLYQSRKYIYTGASAASLEFASVIRLASTPFKAKLLAQGKCLSRFAWQIELGKVIREFQARGAAADPDWESKKITIMQEVITLKFDQDPHCRAVLLSTTGQLVESSPTDNFWADGGNGKGQNQLGLLLTELREKLK